MRPLFSVFIPVRNDARWLPGAIDSVRSQTTDDWELVIGDNVSEDDARTVAAANDDHRIRYRRFDDVVDVVANFNRTALLCEGEWIIPLGADDRLEPNAMATFGGAIRERPDLVMVVGRCSRVDEEGAPAAAVWRFYQGLAPLAPGDYDARGWLRALSADGQPTWSLGSIAFRRSAVESLGGLFDPAAGGASDMELAMRMAIAGPVRYVDTPVMIYTQRTNSDQRQQQRVNRVDDSTETVMGRAFRVGLEAHEAARGPLDRQERRWVQGMIARSFLQRAAQHRVLDGGGGRAAAWRDVRRALRASPGVVFSPRQLLSAAGAVLAPDWLLALANRMLRVRTT
jgi:glycosyltransferase involved in cell wall biosynthesis